MTHASGDHFPIDLAWGALKANKLQTVAYWSAFLTFGMCVAVLGPTVLDLGCITKSTIHEMSWIFVAQTLCTLLGSVMAGYLANKLDPNSMLLISTVMISVTMGLVPFCNTWLQLFAVFVVMGLFMGQIDTVANVRLLQIYGSLVAPFLQALHFSYGLGAFLSPILAEPFLLNEDCSSMIEDMENKNMTSHEAKQLHDAKKLSNVGDAYFVYAAVNVPVIVLILVALFVDRASKRNTPLAAKEGKPAPSKEYVELAEHHIDSSDGESSPPSSGEPVAQREALTTVSIVLVALTSCLLFLGDAAQAAYGEFIYTYTQMNQKVELSSSAGAYLTSTFWGAFALGRLFSIPLSTCISPAVMLFFNLTGSGSAVVLFFFFRDSIPAIFASSAIYGLFLSSIYPSAIALAEQYVSITSLMTSFLVMAAATGEMTSPVILGWTFIEFGASSLIYYELINGIIALTVLVIIVTIGFRAQPRERRYQSIIEKVACCRPAWEDASASPADPIVSSKTALHDDRYGTTRDQTHLQ